VIRLNKHAPKWLTRIMWTLLWGIWGLLAFRLYRELPRDMGPPVCKLQLQREYRMDGFIIGRPEVLAARMDDSKQHFVYSVFDAVTGEKIRDLESRRDVRAMAGSRRVALRQRDQVMTNDPWNIYLPERWHTMAIRDLGTGFVVAREWEVRDPLFRIEYENDDQTLVADVRGVIRRYPMVNWPRLLFCQALLASPLLLRWLLPHWWNWRAAPRQPAVANMNQKATADM